MSKTDEKLMTVKEYADHHHISQQTVYAKTSRNSEKIKGHVFKQNGKMHLDETAQDMLKPIEGNAGLIDNLKRFERDIKKK